MKNQKLSTLLLLLPAFFVIPSAQAEISANVAVTTDYVWRGISQNQEDPALQGGFDYAHESGFYAGIWGSNVSFGGASTELDLYGGWGTELDNGVGLDFGVIRYVYTGSDAASDNDFTEYYAGLSYAGFGFIYSIGDEFGDQFEFSYGHDLENISISAAVGNYDVNDDGDDYTYYTLGISGGFGGKAELGWDISYWDTDIDGDEAAEGRIVATISKEF